MVDWWGIGILLYELVVGQPPFNDKSIPLVIGSILHNDYKPKEYFSKNFANLLQGLLEKDPTRRLGHPDMGGTESIKKHPFFASLDWDQVYAKAYKPPLKPKVKN